MCDYSDYTTSINKYKIEYELCQYNNIHLISFYE